MCSGVLRAIDRRVTGDVLRLLAMLLAAAKHVVEEAKLSSD